MQITTPSGYKVTFKEENELTYGERRQIKRAAARSVRFNVQEVQAGRNVTMTAESGYEMADEMLRVLVKEIIKPDGNKVEGDLFAEIMSWKNEADGDAVIRPIEEKLAGRKALVADVEETPEVKN